MSESANSIRQDIRFLAQERIVDALLRTLALDQPNIINTLRSILIDTEFTHSGKPAETDTVHQQIKNRLDTATAFAESHGAVQRK